jgi:hypothetical protein
VVGPRRPGIEAAPDELEPVPLGPPRSGRKASSAIDDDAVDRFTPGRFDSHTTVSTRAGGGGNRLGGRGSAIAVVGLAALAVVGAALALDGAPGASETPGPRPSETLAVEENDVDPNWAFAHAALALQEAGTFAYQGEVRADAPTAARLGPRFNGTVRVEGAVALPGRIRQAAMLDGGRIVETLVSGRGVWLRQADGDASVAATPWQLDGEVAGPAGLVALPDWLVATDSRAAGPVDEAGRRTFTGLLPDEIAKGLMGGAADATAAVTLTVDGAGLPVHVDVAAAGEMDRFALRVEIVGVGEPVDIAPPGGVEVGITPAYTAEEIVAAGVPGPVQLGELPPGWALAAAELRPPDGRRSCSELLLGYHSVADADGWLSLTVADARCDRPLAPFSADAPATGAPAGSVGRGLANGWTMLGAVRVISGTGTVSVTDGSVQVDADGTLPLADVQRLLATLRPYDRLDQPSLTLDP